MMYFLPKVRLSKKTQEKKNEERESNYSVFPVIQWGIQSINQDLFPQGLQSGYEQETPFNRGKQFQEINVHELWFPK